MPRPQKDGIDYFPLDVNIFSDPKIKILKARYGVDGIAVYIYLLCEIYRAGYFIKLDEDRIFLISDDLSMSVEKVKQVLNFLLERSLFESILFQSDKVLTSAGIQRRFQLAVKERAKKNPIEIKGFWLLDEAETESFIKVNPVLDKSQKKESNSGNNGSKSQELSLKESKEKKSRVKENKEHNSVYVPDEKLNQAIVDFMEYRKKIRKPLTERALELLIEKLDGMTADPNEKIEILNQSVMNGWQGVFPLKEKKSPVKPSVTKPKNNQFHNFEQRDTNYDTMVLERLHKKLGGGEKVE